MKKVIAIILTMLLSFMQIGPLFVSANSSIHTNRIEGIRLDTNLIGNPNVNLVDLNLLKSRLYTIVDNDLNYYFCLDESKYYPPGTIDYELDLDYVYTGDIIWLINNFYAHQEGIISSVESFKDESFETQYAATQLAIWSITNPEMYVEGSSSRSVLDNNPIVVDLMEMAKQHANDTAPTYEALLEQLEKTYIHISDLERKGDIDNFYTFQSKITHNLTNEFTINNIQAKLEISSSTDPNIDITSQSKINVDIQNKTIDIQIPKTIIDDAINTNKNELLLTANATIESKSKYYLRYTPVGTSTYQPLATRNTLQKNVVDFATISTANLTSISVYKEWDDANNQDGIRPNEIEVQLLANGENYGPVKVLNENNNWAYSWNGLSINDTNGTPIKYTVKEITQIPGYDSTTTNVNDDLYKITNRYTPEVISISGKKIWDDNNNQDGIRPNEIEVKLYANNEHLTTTTATEKSNWTYEFSNLPKFDNGEEIKYTVTETPIPNYTNDMNGYDIINHYTPGKTSVKVTKNWDDKNNQDGIRPNKINVQLYANGEPKGEEVVLNEANNWTTTWADLDEKADGKTITYSVKEVTDLGAYDVTINDDNQGNIIITNSYTPELIDLNGKKVWDDNNNQDGVRPEKVVVNLLANGQKIDSTEVSADNQWHYEFTKLPKYEDGVEIQYTVTENTVPEYSTSIDGTTITNHYTPGKTSATVTKNWDDANNQDGIRPNEINVQLYANGEPKGKEVVLNEANNWTATWSDLDEKIDGETITYSVKEVDVPDDYTVSIDDTNQGNIIITNSYTPTENTIKPSTPGGGSSTSPGNTSKPTTSGGESSSHTTGNISVPTTSGGESASILPQTGEKSSLFYILIGIVLIALSSYVLRKKLKIITK